MWLWSVFVVAIAGAAAFFYGNRESLSRLWLGGSRSEAGSQSDVPVINVTHLRSRDPLARDEVVAKLAVAASTFGVVRLVDHGIDVAGSRSRAWEFFKLPTDRKNCSSCSLRDPSIGFQRGYIPFASESGLSSVKEVKEGFCYGYEWPSDRESKHPFQAANVWPEKETLASLSANWQAGMMDFFEETVKLSVTAVEALAEALGERGRNLPSLCKGGDTISQMRMFHYLPPDSSCGKQCMGSSPHTDWHFVTIISRDDASVLEYYDVNNGQWKMVHSEPGELLMLVGDWLSAYSGGVYHAPAHRVLSPEKESSLSFVLFFYPSMEARLPEAARAAAAWGEEVNSVEDSMYDLAWGEYALRKWTKVMSNR